MQRRIMCLILLAATSFCLAQNQVAITSEEYFHRQGLSFLIFHNHYTQGHQGGLEIIQHGERVATNGDIRLQATPGQLDLLPTTGERSVNQREQTISVPAEYTDLDILYKITVRPEGESFLITVDFARPLPNQWIGKVCFQMEFFPGSYFNKTWQTDHQCGIFPRQANSPVKRNSSNKIIPVPITSGSSITLAPEDRYHRITIESLTSELSLYDARIPDNNGWFAISSPVPAGATTGAIKWRITPNVVPDWHRSPVILYSQIGYHPNQPKKAIIELDANVTDIKNTKLMRLNRNESEVTVLEAPPEEWGTFLRYKYATFNFSDVNQTGMYRIAYGDTYSSYFPIGRDVYQNNVWQPTLETFFPVQMCHMHVRDRLRVWHGACHLDDALQAPISHDHFDGYRQGESTPTDFEPYEHIDGLNIGGWHDAGDYDLAAGSQASTTQMLSLIHETFDVSTDQTTIIQEERYVELHKPDGKPDILQQIEHGVLNVLGGHNAAGHSFIGIISPTLQQYTHLGDAATMTDNEVYDASDIPMPVAENRIGKMDDRWAFTNRDTGLEYKVAAALAAASRALAFHNDSLAQVCFAQAENIWEYENTHEPVRFRAAYVPNNPDVQHMLAAVELWQTTRKQKYRTFILNNFDIIDNNFTETGWAVARIIDTLDNASFTERFSEAAQEYKTSLDEEIAQNPFAIPYHPRIWGVGWNIQYFAARYFYLSKSMPDLFEPDVLFNVLDFVLGRHPASNTSFVSGVGAHSLTTAYGVNRAEWSYIPGGNASGVALIRPDFPELKEPWPYLWQQSEYVIHGAATFMFCVLAANYFLNE